MADPTSTVQRRRPSSTPLPEGGIGNKRVVSFGDQAFSEYGAGRPNVADEGSYYTVTNPTIDTTVAYGVLAAFATTTVAFLISNTAPAGGRTITLDYLKLRVTVAPANATNWKYVVEMDNSVRTATAPTGGVSRSVLNCNPGVSNDFEGTVWAFTGGTVLTIMAAQNARIIDHGSIAQSIPVALDELVVFFGHSGSAGTAVTTVGRRVTNGHPVVIPPGCSAAISLYGTSNAITGMSAEYSLGMWQR